jgi:hypothetical protein
MEYIKSILCSKSVHLSFPGDGKITFPRYCQSPRLQSYFYYFMSLRYNYTAQEPYCNVTSVNKTRPTVTNLTQIRDLSGIVGN